MHGIVPWVGWRRINSHPGITETLTVQQRKWVCLRMADGGWLLIKMQCHWMYKTATTLEQHSKRRKKWKKYPDAFLYSLWIINVTFLIYGLFLQIRWRNRRSKRIVAIVLMAKFEYECVFAGRDVLVLPSNGFMPS